MKIAGIETALYVMPPKIPLAIGETLNHRWAFEDYARAGAARILQPDVARIGGPSEWMRVAHIAAEPGSFLALGNRLA